jgi:6,7-dimethyl-8-ribityllumazine synthase
MADYKAIPCNLQDIPKTIKIACVNTWRNEIYVKDLLQQNVNFLQEHDFSDISIFEVPGSLELP